MAWICYRLVYRAVSPIHIGYHKLGNVQRTRYYIPGKSMWGAATAHLTRSIMRKDSSNDPNLYRIIGEFVKKNLIFSYFYVVIEPERPLLPRYGKGGLQYGNGIEADLFEYQFIHSFASTAIKSDNLAAEEGTLHEVEFISPCPKDKEGERINFMGYLFAQSEARVGQYSLIASESPPSLFMDGIDLFQDVFKELWVGGERRYGFGQLELQKDELTSTTVLFNTLKFRIMRSKNKPTVDVPRGNPLPAHLEVEGTHDKGILGDIEPIVGREWEDQPQRPHRGAGQRLSYSNMSWVPGSISTKKITAEIGDYGILRVKA